MRRGPAIAAALAVLSQFAGCRDSVTDDDAVDRPDASSFDASTSPDSSVGDDAGAGSLCPEGSPAPFDNSFSPFAGGEESVDLEIVDFSWFRCENCAEFAGIWEEMMAGRPDIRARVRLYFHHFPFSAQDSWEVHAATVAAANQGMESFWALHDHIYEAISDENTYYSAQALRTYCDEVLGLDMAQYDEDVADPDTMSFLSWDMAQGEAAGVVGTPSVFICGEKIPAWGDVENVVDGYLYP